MGQVFRGVPEVGVVGRGHHVRVQEAPALYDAVGEEDKQDDGVSCQGDEYGAKIDRRVPRGALFQPG